MLRQITSQFLDYCQLVDFSTRSVQTLTARIGEFSAYLGLQKIRSVGKIRYSHLVEFVADYNSPSIHVRKSRLWALRQFYHFLTLHQHVAKNIALRLAYPKIEKTVPQFLTPDEYNRLIRHFGQRADTKMGLRNLIIILLLGTLGLRTSTLIAIDVEDVDLTFGLVWVREKGNRERNLIMPQCLCKMIKKHLLLSGPTHGPLLMSKRKKRISQRTLQHLFHRAALQTGIDKKLHARLFRHTAATHINRVAGTDITQHVLGHNRRANTLKYAHLNPDQYALYMKKHPYMKAVELGGSEAL